MTDSKFYLLGAGVVSVGDLFDWQPYGTDGWPRAYDRVRVTRIVYCTSAGEHEEATTTADLCVDDDMSDVRVWSESLCQRPGTDPVWNELPHFVEMTRKVS